MLAALYDIHANLPALDAVLRDAEGAGVDAYLLGGERRGFTTTNSVCPCSVTTNCSPGLSERTRAGFRKKSRFITVLMPPVFFLSSKKSTRDSLNGCEQIELLQHRENLLASREDF